MTWSASVELKDGKFQLHVEAAEDGTPFMLSIPVYIHLPNKKLAMRPLALKGRAVT